MSTFKRVILDHSQAEIAKVNLKTKTLYLSPAIWSGLPKEEKDFVLFHEEGHLTMQTADEFAANKYAVGKFLKAGTFTNKELGQKIMVMRSILDKADGQTAPMIAELVAGVVSPITQALPVLGIGSKSRIKETQATAAANAKVYEAQAKVEAAKSKNTMKIVLIGGVLLVVAVVVYFTLKLRK